MQAAGRDEASKMQDLKGLAEKEAERAEIDAKMDVIWTTELR